MKEQATIPKFFALAGLGFVTTVMTVCFGTSFLRVLHKGFKPAWYWITGLVFVGLFIWINAVLFAAIVGSVWLLVGSYGEFEKQGFGWKKSGILSLSLSAIVMAGGLILALRNVDINSWDLYVRFLNEQLDKFRAINPALKFDALLIAEQSPSVLMSLLVLGLAKALIFEKATARYFKVPVDRIASELKLLEFRLPDSFIWIFLLSFLFSMVSFGVSWLPVVGFNVVNVGAILFFFQGLAALEVFFMVMKTGFVLRFLTYIILVGYMFVVLSVVGLIDYWVDFRARMRRLQTAETN